MLTLYVENKISDTLASIFTIMCIGITHVTNGYIIVLCLYYAPEYVLEQDLKGKATTIISFCIIFGSFIGGLLANLLTKNIVELIKP